MLVISGSIVYAGGDFGSIGGKDRHNPAALDAQSGMATDWSPTAACLGDFCEVDALVVDGSTVYAGGAFVLKGDDEQASVAAIDAAPALVRPST